MSGHLGFNLVVGPEVSTNGRSDGHPNGGLPGPGPTLAFRFEWVLSEVLLLGVEARGFVWTTDTEQALGYQSHDTLDLGVQPGYRIAGIDGHHSELHVSLPIGIGVERFRARTAPLRERVEGSPSFHVGALVGYQRRWHRSAWGHVFEAGVIYHHVRKRFVYAVGRADEVVYQPIDLFLRAGLVVYFGGG